VLCGASGHITGTGMTATPGKVGIAAHRDTFFRLLRNVRKDDVITLTTASAEYRYRVVSTKVVYPDDVSVLNANGQEVLTLVTCYPFFFVGSAPDRFIVRAERTFERGYGWEPPGSYRSEVEGGTRLDAEKTGCGSRQRQRVPRPRS
jgi:LPXTG-site transpeptidase (sortase) family protein